MKKLIVFLIALGLVGVCGSAQANLLNNGSFELPGGAAHYYTMSSEIGTWHNVGDWGYDPQPDDWYYTPDDPAEVYDARIWYATDVNGTAEFPDGDYAMEIDYDSSAQWNSIDVLKQDIANLDAGTTYYLSFYMWGTGGFDTTELDVDLSGTDVVSILDDYGTVGNDSLVELVSTSFTVPATGAYTIEFSCDPGGTGSNHPFIDRAVLDTVPIPEPATMALLGLGSLALIRRRK